MPLDRHSFDLLMGSSATILGAALWAALLIPTAKILRRMGFSGWWSPLTLTGVGLVAGLWVLAYRRWSALEPHSKPDISS